MKNCYFVKTKYHDGVHEIFLKRCQFILLFFFHRFFFPVNIVMEIEQEI